MRWSLVMALALAAAACGASGAGDPDAGAGDRADAAPDPGGPVFRASPQSVWVMEAASIEGGASSFGSVQASFRDAAIPFVHTEVARDGACRLLVWDSPGCGDTCWDGLCDSTGACLPYPEQRSVGALTIAGLRAPRTLQPDDLDGYYGFVEGELFDPGAEIRVTAAGDELPGFELAVTAPSAGNPAVDGASAPEFPPFAAGEGYTFTWTPVDPTARVRLRMASDAGHGLPSAAMIECDGPDTGELYVAPALLDEFIDGANWSCGECPTQILMRYRRAVDGDRELVVGTQLQFYYWGSR